MATWETFFPDKRKESRSPEHDTVRASQPGAIQCAGPPAREESESAGERGANKGTMVYEKKSKKYLSG